MKTLLFLALLLSGCTEKARFNVGDCIQHPDELPERWDRPYIFRILEVGTYSYRTNVWFAEGSWWSDGDFTHGFFSRDSLIQCPREK